MALLEAAPFQATNYCFAKLFSLHHIFNVEETKNKAHRIHKIEPLYKNGWQRRTTVSNKAIEFVWLVVVCRLF